MNARGHYGNNPFPRYGYGYAVPYGYALPYVGQEASPAPPAPSASPTPSAFSIPPGFGVLTPGEMDAVRAHRRALGYMGAAPSSWSREVLSGGYSSVLGRIFVMAAGAFAGYQLSSPGKREVGAVIGATTAAFFNVVQRQANTLDRIADKIQRR